MRYLHKTIDNRLIITYYLCTCGLFTAGHHVATGDHGYSGQSGQRFAQLHLPFPFRPGGSVSAAFFSAHIPLLQTLLALSHEVTRDNLSFTEDLQLPTHCPRPPCVCSSSSTLFAEVSTKPRGEVRNSSFAQQRIILFSIKQFPHFYCFL